LYSFKGAKLISRVEGNWQNMKLNIVLQHKAQLGYNVMIYMLL